MSTENKPTDQGQQQQRVFARVFVMIHCRFGCEYHSLMGAQARVQQEQRAMVSLSAMTREKELRVMACVRQQARAQDGQAMVCVIASVVVVVRVVVDCLRPGHQLPPGVCARLFVCALRVSRQNQTLSQRTHHMQHGPS